MNIADKWFSKHTQQAVMSRVAVLHSIAKTGPSSQTIAEPAKTINSGKYDVFIMGESRVGGQDRVGGTP